MPITGWKVVYNERVYNVIGLGLEFEYGNKAPEKGVKRPKFINITFVDEDGTIGVIEDEAFMFQFIRAIN